MIEVSNGVLRLRMAPDFGARITDLTDLRSGRNWIVPGALAGSPAETASYIAGRPNGWDECFPTVAACRVADWGGAVRDHGALWARPWDCRATAHGIIATYNDPRFRFRRALRLARANVALRYSLTARSPHPLPWLWSQHCLLACRPGERIEATGIGAWRDAAGAEVSPGPVLPPEAGIAGKYFAQVTDRAAVMLAGSQGRFEISWRRRDAASVGLWFSYGGWPAEDPLYQIGIEPASLPFNRLSDAMDAGAAAWLAPGETRQWHSRISLSS